MIESLLFSGWFPIEWMIGQLLIGLICGIIFKKNNIKNNVLRYALNITTIVVSVFIGIALVKTIVACVLYSIPFGVKFIKDVVAFAVDVIPMIIGLFIAEKIKKKKSLMPPSLKE